MKKLLSILLSTLMIFTCMSTNVFAASSPTKDICVGDTYTFIIQGYQFWENETAPTDNSKYYRKGFYFSNADSEYIEYVSASQNGDNISVTVKGKKATSTRLFLHYKGYNFSLSQWDDEELWDIGFTVSPSTPSGGSSSGSSSSSCSSDSSSESSSSSSSNSSATWTPIVPVRSYIAAENTGKGAGTTELWNKPYTCSVAGSKGNLGNHNKATEPYCAVNANVLGWTLIKNDIATKKTSKNIGDNYTVVMNGATKVDTSIIKDLNSKKVKNLTLQLENGTSFAVPTSIVKGNSTLAANGIKTDLFIDITCNTTDDVNKGIIDTQFVPLETIKACGGDTSTRMLAVRSNNTDSKKSATVAIKQLNKAKKTAKIYLYDYVSKKAIPYKTVTYANGIATFPILVGTYNIFVVEE